MMAPIAALFLLLSVGGSNAQFLIGRGIADITGLVSEGAHYGYANPSQDARGMHSRQYARTFIVADATNSTQRVVIVVAEITMSTQSLHDEIVERLRDSYDGLYTEKNLMISGTHSHCTPGGAHTYWMYAAPSGGFINQTFDIYVNGILESIDNAHSDLQEGQILFTSGELLNASISRSPYAYDQNPQDERDRYAYNVDKDMYVMKMTHDSQPIGMLNLFPVHTTTMKSYNHLISSDNKGYAAYLFEKAYNPNSLPGQAQLIGAFAQSNEGDVTPNIRGDFCDNTGEPCSYERSTCPEDPLDPALCNSYGPTGDIFEDTMIIGERQFLKAQELFDAAADVITGAVDFRHVWVNMSDVTVQDGDDGPTTTCRPAMGYSFAAGATDGPGVRPFTQGELEGDVGGDVIEGVIDGFLNGSVELQECHAPKPVLPARQMTSRLIPKLVPITSRPLWYHIGMYTISPKGTTMVGTNL